MMSKTLCGYQIEVERATNYRKPILSVQIENMELNGKIELYIGTTRL